jgi:ABC-type Fe3+-hydroxamate transport system substrate-binding protein/adenosylcobinamide amidohydrolase
MGDSEKKIRWALLITVLLTALLLPQSKALALDIIDARGKAIHFAQPPRRIVSLVPAVTEMLFEIDAGDRIVGLTYHDTLPEAVRKSVVGGFFSPSFEKIVELSPDVVMVSSLHGKIVDQCGALGIPTLQMDIGTLPQSFQTMVTLGRLMGRESAALALQKSIRAQLDLIARKVETIPENQRLRTMRLMGRDRITTPGDDSFQNQLIAAAGGIPPVLGKTGPVVDVTLEEWRAFNPQVLYCCGGYCGGGRGGDKEAVLRPFNQPGWKDVDAVRNGRIYDFPCDLTCRAGAHSGDFVAWLSARLYGDHFAKADGFVTRDQVLTQHALPLDLSYVKRAAIVHSRIFDFTHKSLLVTFSAPMKVVSTLEGMRDGVVAAGNHFFPPPCWYIGHERGLEGLKTTVCNVLARKPEETALLFTGADMDHLAVQRKSFRDMTVYALVTAGARSNAMRAAKDTGSYYEPGTINMVVLTNMALTPRAMNRAIIAATEAKSAALEDLDIRSSYTPGVNGATGTGTDNIIVVQGAGAAIDNSGGHSKMGELISRVVYQGVREALYKQNGFASGRNVLQRLKERNISIRQLLDQDDCPCGLKPHEFAAAMETLLLDPDYASFVEAALAVSDHYERGLVSDLSAFRQWARTTAQQVAGAPIEKFDELIATDGLPPVLQEALNALANGVKHRQERFQGQ